MELQPKNKEKVKIVLDGGLEIPAFRKAIAKNLGIVARMGYGVRSTVTELTNGVRTAINSESDDYPLSVSVPIDRLPAVHTSLEHRAAELEHLSTIRSSSDPEFHKAYGSPEYLALTQAASQSVDSYMNNQPPVEKKN